MRSTSIFLGLLVLSAEPTRGEIVLFDGSTNTRPDQQGWFYLTNPTVGSSATATAGGGVTTLDTTAVIGDQAGYFSRITGLGSHPLMPTLDRASGYTVRLDARLVSEAHASDDRAGFSLIVLGEDLRGVELGFWTNEVWAQADSPLFTHAEGAAFNTTVATRYDLSVLGDSYTLFAGGSPLLTGALRDYSAFGPPYTTRSFLFVGDDTSSAGARVELARIGVTLAAIPEPGSAVLLGIGVLGALGLAARRPFGRSSCAFYDPSSA